MSKVVVITGASTGLGLAAAVLLAKHSHVVYATMRNLDKRGAIEKAAEEAGISGSGHLHVTQLDVTDEHSVTSALGSPLLFLFGV
jgi:NAD(P)-dependent dehydrogenase (short-subunit alcohol dehydrogenase family)